jgi:cellulose synthase/poly-beta-1,6-N-acetylglucosamine synthase-like glycosyltransferase
MRVAICIPARGQMEVTTAFDLTMMAAYMAGKKNIDLNVYTSQGTLIFDQRNSLVHTAVMEKCDYILFIDADMRFPKNTLERLLAHKKDIIGVNATTRMMPPKPTARNIQINEDGSVDWLEVFSNKEKGIGKVDAIGCGVMLIKTSCLKDIPQPYFYFEQLLKGKLLGEDIYFCIKAKDAGIDTWVDHDLSMEIGHVGSYTYGWDDIKD